MTEKIRESISAFMDDEISEIELHRLLRQFSNEDTEQGSIKESWISYQQIRTITNGESSISTDAHLALHNRISAAISEEDIETTEIKTTTQRWAVPTAGFAVAASLVLAVFVGVGQDQSSEVASNTPNKTTQVVDAQAVSMASRATPQRTVADTTQSELATHAVAFDIGSDESELRELDAEKQNQLRDYLNRHERMTRKNPLSRTVIYPAKSNDN